MSKSKEEIIGLMKDSFQALMDTAAAVPQERFNVSTEGKWSAAENVSHMARATKMTNIGFSQRKFMLSWIYGKPKRASQSYDDIVSNYHRKLDNGAQASGVYVPKKIDYDATQLLAKMKWESDRLLETVSKKWTEEQLDAYQVKHPVLGPLTFRELAYFTIYHNGHHTATIRKYYLA